MQKNTERQSARQSNLIDEFFRKRAKQFNLEMVFLFGSRTTFFYRNDSDIDLGVVFDDKAASDKFIFSKITDISLQLLKLINLEINVVPIYPDFRKPLLYYNIIVLGKPLYIKDYDKYITLRNEAIFHMEDFSLFGEKWKMDLAKKN